ncbi:MAG: 6-phosphogluconolactonase, partial [bacterium]
MPNLTIFDDEAALAGAAADHFISKAQEALAARGRFRAALSGGRGPRGLFQVLAQKTGALDWRKVELYWVDERWVDWKSADSNYGEAGRLWLDGLKAGPGCFPMYRGPGDPNEAAELYETLLARRLASKPPVFDLVLLG